MNENQLETSANLGKFLNLRQVLELLPISRSAWYAGQKTGAYPLAIRLGHRTALYRVDDIRGLIRQIDKRQDKAGRIAK